MDAALVGLLLWIAREDVLRFRIPNWSVVVLAAAFPVVCLLEGQTGLLLPRGLFAVAAFALLVAAFAAGICGGGDAKLLAVALLWIGPREIVAFAILMLVAVAIYAFGSALRILPARRDGGCLRIPLGPCIAAAWIGVVVLSRVVA